MTIKSIFATAFITASALTALTGAASAGGGNFYGSHGHFSGHSHVDIGPAGSAEDYNYYDCKDLKARAIHTGRGRDWRAYRSCIRNAAD